MILSSLSPRFFFLIICATDTLKTKIPNPACLGLIVCGLVLHYITNGAGGLARCFLGLLAGFSLLIAPYLIGGVGAGDVKALAALGALLGPVAIFHVFIYTCLVGGVLALLHYLWAGKLVLRLKSLWIAFLNFYFSITHRLDCLSKIDTGKKLKFPYAAAIAFGYFAYLSWGGIL